MSATEAPATLSRSLRNAGFTVAVFLLGAAGVRSLLPFAEVTSIKPKYQYFAAHKDSYDILFFGSSRFYQQIIPAEFDRAVAEGSGDRFHSFNTAYRAVYPPESYYLVRRFLALKPARLKWVFIDAMDINPELDDLNQPPRHQVYWHDWQHTLLDLERLAEMPDPPASGRWPLAEAHLSLFARVAANVGRGSDIFDRWLRPHDQDDSKPEWFGAEGFSPGRESHFATAAEEADFNQKVKLQKRGMPSVPPSPVLDRAMRKLIAEVRAAGAEPIFVTTPTLNFRENWNAVPSGAELYSYSDPNLFPALYDPAIHGDAWHLNEAGAHIFTKLLAERFVQTLAAKTPGAK